MASETTTCPACGYDVRASIGAGNEVLCPECGAVTPIHMLGLVPAWRFRWFLLPLLVLPGLACALQLTRAAEGLFGPNIMSFDRTLWCTVPVALVAVFEFVRGARPASAVFPERIGVALLLAGGLLPVNYTVFWIAAVALLLMGAIRIAC